MERCKRNDRQNDRRNREAGIVVGGGGGVRGRLDENK